jgi:hypothetical protein
MGEAVGLDLGAATSVAARLRGAEVEPVVLVPTADLGATSARHHLESLAARAVGAGTLPAVGVAIPTLDPESQAEVEAAAREAFADPLLVLRPAAAAAWFRHTDEVHPDALLVVVEAEETLVAVTIVRPRAGIPTLERPPVGESLSSGAPVLDAIDTVAATMNVAGLVPTDLDVAVIVGGAKWLAELAEGITAATDLAAVVDPEPRAAVAYGAALLAAQSDGFGVGTALALGTPAVGAGLAAAAGPTAGPPLGSALGEAAGATSGAGAGLGAAMRNMGQGKDAPTDPLGADVGEAAGGYKEPPSAPGGEGGDGGEGGGSPKRPPSRLPAGGLKRGLVLAAPAVVAVLAVGGLTVRSCTQDPDSVTLATSSEPAEPDDPSTTATTGSVTDSASPGGSDKPDPLAPTSSETTTSGSTSTTRPTTTTRRTVPTTPGTPPPSDPVVPPSDPPPPGDTTPPSVTNLFRSVGDIYANNGQCQLPMTTVLSATITDDVGVAAATINWSAGAGFGGQLTMARAQGDTWSATLGPIPNDTLTTDDTLPVTWSVVAVDAAGNKADSGPAGGRGAVNFHGCWIVIG